MRETLARRGSLAGNAPNSEIEARLGVSVRNVEISHLGASAASLI
jgi:hypothetical protein